MGNRGQDSVTTQNRLEWVDVARGIGIIAVVVGHAWTGGAVHAAMYSFHMPLFFLLSGILSRPLPPGHFLWRQLVGQMRPYALFLLLLLLADQIIERAKGYQPIFHRWPQDVWPVVLGGTWLKGPYTVFWFVPCLMVARIIFNIAIVRWPGRVDWRWALLLIPATILAYGAHLWARQSPLGLLTVPMAVLLLWAGWFGGQMRWRWWMAPPLILLAVTGLTGLVGALDMKIADYGWPFLSIAAAMATSVLIFRFSAAIASFAWPIAAIGQAALVIMYLHVAFIHYLTPYCGRPWLLAAGLAGPLAIHRLILRSALARRWLL